MITHLTGTSYWRGVPSSWIFIWNEPSPVSSTDGISGQAIAAPIAAGRPKPIVPRPPELIQRRGSGEGKDCGAPIWCWPTSEDRMQLPLSVAFHSDSTRYCGLISVSGESSYFNG